MKKTYRVKVDVKVPVTVIVEAEDGDRALALGEERARDVIQPHLPDRSKDAPYEYVALEAHEMVPPKTMNA